MALELDGGASASASSCAAASAEIALRRKLFSEVPAFDGVDVPENKREILG